MEEEEPLSSSSSPDNDPDPNCNARGVSAVESVWLVDTEPELRTAYYCEENVWRLVCRKLLVQPGAAALPDLDNNNNNNNDSSNNDSCSSFWVVFVSNPVKNVPMFQQRAAQSADTACCWDYHVILVGRDSTNNGGGSPQVWDMDSRLPYPCPLPHYLAHTFPYEWPDPHGPQFRILPATTYLQTFASNRSHMFNRTQRRWTAPPPQYEIIQTDHDTHTLDLLLDFAAPPSSSSSRASSSTADERRDRLLQQGALGRILRLKELKVHRF